MKELIEKLEKEIAEQTRNGREEVYIEAEDLNKLGYGIDKNKQGRVWVDVVYLKLVINRHKFKDDLRVEIQPVKTYKNLLEDIKRIEREK